MIAFDFEYYRPSTLEECIKVFQNLKVQGKRPIYYAGGTEIICRARGNDNFFNAVVDIKSVEECNVLDERENQLVIGSAVTLNKICEADIFPLLTMTSKWVADNTSRNKITIGGNICSAIPFKEAALPFLLCDSWAVIAENNTIKTLPFKQAFNEKMQLVDGTMLIQVRVHKNHIKVPFNGVRKQKIIRQNILYCLWRQQ